MLVFIDFTHFIAVEKERLAIGRIFLLSERMTVLLFFVRIRVEFQFPLVGPFTYGGRILTIICQLKHRRLRISSLFSPNM